MAPEASDMMRAPDAEMAPAQTLERAVKAYAHRDDRFALDKKIYGQYFQLYYQRLMLLLPRLKLAVEAKWPGASISPRGTVGRPHGAMTSSSSFESSPVPATRRWRGSTKPR